MVVVTVTCFLVSLATSIPRNNYNIEKKKRHDIFVNYWFIFSVGSPLTARIFTLGNTCTCISSISHWMFGFQLDQTLSNERVWCSSAIQQNPLTKKNWIDHSIFEVNQTLSLGYRTKWNSYKEYSNGTKSNVSVPNSWWQVC